MIPKVRRKVDIHGFPTARLTHCQLSAL
ncbi:MAG: hypothetical protein RLY70_4189, partial [Planctomycetota bacterium]